MHYSKELKDSILRKILPPNNESITKIAKEEGVPICSKTRKQFCIKSVYYRFENFLLPVYNKAVEKGFVF